MGRRLFGFLLFTTIFFIAFSLANSIDSRTDDFSSNATIAIFNNVTWLPGNVSFYGELNKKAFNISENNVYMVTLTSSSSIKGIANDGTYIYINDAGARIKKALFNGSVISTHTIANLAADENDLASNGRFLYARNYGTIYLINLTDNSSKAVTIDSSHPILTGRGWMTGTIVDMPDKRIGVISDSGTNPITLRLYDASENGTYFTWSEDFNIASSWATDNHGIVSDGDSLVLISFQEGHRIFSLVNLSLESSNSWNIRPTGMGNPTFITYDHVGKRVLIGDYGDSDFAVFNGSFSTGNFTSTTTELGYTIFNITNVSWVSSGDTLGSTIRVQVSADNGSQWYGATKGAPLGAVFSGGNRSLLYRVFFTTSSGTNLSLDSLSIHWTEDALSVIINTPTNSTYYNATITFNVSLNENGTVWGTLDGGRTNFSLSSIDSQRFNATNYSMGDGNYTFTAYASKSDGSKNNSKMVNFTIYAADTDGDGLPDINDTLIGNESSVNSSGVTRLNITIGGNTTSGMYSDTQPVVFYDGTQRLLNFTYNFSAGTLDLRRVVVQTSSNYLILNFSGQLQGNKTVYLTKNSFSHVCVKDADVASISALSTSCDGAEELNFDTCLNANLTLQGITCTDIGSQLRFDNLAHSVLRGTSTSTTNETQFRVSSGSTRRCVNEWLCSSWSFCSSNFTQQRTCALRYLDGCTPTTPVPTTVRACPDILFDIDAKVLTPFVLPWTKLKTQVMLSEINRSDLLDIMITYRILQDTIVIHEESETKAIPGNLTFVKDLDASLPAGSYTLQVVLTYGKEQTASSMHPFRVLARRVTVYAIAIVLVILFLLGLAYNEYRIRKQDEQIIHNLKRAKTHHKR